MKYIQIIDNLFVKKTSNIWAQLIRYIFVGGTAYIVDFGSLFFLTDVVNLNYLVSAGLAFMLGLLVNYAISIRWVFPNSKLPNKVVEFSLFTVIGVVGLLLTILSMYLLTEICGFNYLISKIIASVIVFLWNFFARKFFVFC